MGAWKRRRVTPNPLITLFRQCAVRIDDGSGAFLGSGFLVAPGLVLTCAHVVHGAASFAVSWGGVSVGATVVAASPLLEQVADART